MASVYLFKGSDDYTKNKELEKLVSDNLDADFSDFDMQEVFGDTVTCDKVLTGASISPFGSKKRVVLVRFAQKISKEEQRIISNNLHQVPDSGLLIFQTPAPEVKDGKIVSGYEVTPELQKSINKIGEVRDFSLITRKKDIAEKVVPFVIDLFEKAQKKISRETASIFVTRVGTDFVLLNTESQKVISYALNDEVITSDMVYNITSATPEEKIFEFLEYVCNKQASKAIFTVEDLYTDGNDPQVTSMKIISLLGGQVRQIWQGIILLQMKLAAVSQVLSGGQVSVKKDNIEEKYLKYFTGNSILTKAAWQQSKLLKLAKNNSFKTLAYWISCLEEADAKLKGYDSNPEDPIDIIKLLVYKMVRV